MLKLQGSSLDWALKHIENFGDTNIFPVPFEYEAIRYIWDEDTKELPNGKSFKEYLRNQDILNWAVRSFKRSLTPKHKYGFRLSTQLDPLDTIIYTALVYEIGEDIEARRVPIEKNVSFSYRFKPNNEGRMFDPNINYRNFLEYCSSKVDLFLGDDSIQYVVVADIADFYPRMYLHPLENALSSSTAKTNHAIAIKKLLNSWNYSISYGIPVGQSASALLAELTLNDIDEGLLSEGVDFCRYVDDFRIFCKTKKEAYEQLALLANMLFDNHGLTLQQHKTRILSVEQFKENYLKTEESMEIDSLNKKFSDILGEFGIDDPYASISYEMLPKDLQLAIDSMNLETILKEQLELENIDTRIVGFILKRMAQLNNTDILDLILDNSEKLYSAFKHVFNYLNEVQLTAVQKEEVSVKLYKILDSSIIGHLEFHRMWIFKTFSNGSGCNTERLTSFYNEYYDDFSRREIILALGTANQQSWFRPKKRNAMEFPTWQRRAFIKAAKCLPGDEASHWYRSILTRLDPLEIAVVKWSQK
ncbi:RNA-directed DNA polymerase [Evansella halocellulosilytica]|uniref:RNA-directed DNA polymerase n=1 Tax=Evansella halocellulosilytica TaxID=2011013 RepID=UPI000BB836E0|nr:RNA-directed DNA polymerase [Evansella halocellulosilytica]